MQRDYRTLFGVLLIVAGALLALQQFGYLQGDWNDALFAGLWALGSLYFYDQYRQNKAHWWFGLVAFILGGLAVTNALDLIVPPVGDVLGGGIFLGAIGAGFLIVYRRNPTNWWAIIPAGTLFSLALISMVNDLPFELPFDSGGILFIGLGLTFLTLTQITVNGEKLSWGFFPAIPLFALGLFVAFGSAASWNLIWPTALVLLGACFLIEAIRKR